MMTGHRCTVFVSFLIAIGLGIALRSMELALLSFIAAWVFYLALQGDEEEPSDD